MWFWITQITKLNYCRKVPRIPHDHPIWWSRRHIFHIWAKICLVYDIFEQGKAFLFLLRAILFPLTWKLTPSPLTHMYPSPLTPLPLTPHPPAPHPSPPYPSPLTPLPLTPSLDLSTPTPWGLRTQLAKHWQKTPNRLEIAYIVTNIYGD